MEAEVRVHPCCRDVPFSMTYYKLLGEKMRRPDTMTAVTEASQTFHNKVAVLPAAATRNPYSIKEVNEVSATSSPVDEVLINSAVAAAAAKERPGGWRQRHYPVRVVRVCRLFAAVSKDSPKSDAYDAT